mgnify:CR=1 FL=1
MVKSIQVKATIDMDSIGIGYAEYIGLTEDCLTYTELDQECNLDVQVDDADSALISITFVDGLPDSQIITLATWRPRNEVVNVRFRCSSELLSWVKYNMPDCADSLQELMEVPMEARADILNVVGLCSESGRFALCCASYMMAHPRCIS